MLYRPTYTPMPARLGEFSNEHIDQLLRQFITMVETDAILIPYVDYWASGGMNESAFIELPAHGGE